MEFELWLFAIKNLAQTYEMSQMIYSQLPKAEKDALKDEYERSVGGRKDNKKEKKADKNGLKKYEELIGNLKNAMSVTERIIERNSVKSVLSKMPADPNDPDQEFLLRMFLKLELTTSGVISYLNYLGLPVTAEGRLESDAYGNYVLKPDQGSDKADFNQRRILSEGMLVEFFSQNRWEIGKFRKEAGSPFGCYFIGFSGEEFHVVLEGLHVRLRG